MTTKAKKMIGRALSVLLFTGGVIGFILLVSATDQKQKTGYVSGVNINIDHENGLFFMDEKDVVNIIASVEDSVVGKPIKTLDFTAIEKALKEDPFIRNAEIFVTMLGEININVIQREPLIRVINKEGVNYYIDKSGQKMPVSSKFTSHVPLASGPWLADANPGADSLNSAEKELAFLAGYLSSHEFWDAQIEQIYVDRRGEYHLVPKLGGHIIQLGKLEDLDEKFKKLLIFYREGLAVEGWDRYDTINLKFRKQIVCTIK